MSTPSTSYDWIRDIKPEIKALDAIPLTGSAPPFPWDEFSAKIARSFEREGISIKPGELTWRTKEHLFEGLGDAPFPLIFSIPSLRGEVCWVMPEQEMAVLESLLLTKESHPITFQDHSLSVSFYRFFALEVLYNLTQVPFDKTISPILTNETTLPAEDSLCLDISLTIQKQTVWGRLIISPSMRRSWVEHFAAQEPTALTKSLSERIEVTVHLEAGNTQLSLKEWNSIHAGDFLILDSCSLDRDSISSGRLSLTVNGRQAFRGKLKEGNIKILELPLIHEVDTPMSKEEDEDDLSDLDLTEGHEAAEEEETTSEEVSGSADQEIEEETEAEPKEQATPTVTRGPLEPEGIPISIVVEVGRLQMTVDKLLQLEPGNLLELNVHPEDGVDLTINGRVVGKGELIRIGESLGVRILDLGK